MSEKIYNKNAREKALLEEAYNNVYDETEVVEEGKFRSGWQWVKGLLKPKPVNPMIPQGLPGGARSGIGQALKNNPGKAGAGIVGGLGGAVVGSNIAGSDGIKAATTTAGYIPAAAVAGLQNAGDAFKKSPEWGKAALLGGGAYLAAKMLQKKDKDEEEEHIDIDLDRVRVVDVDGLDPNEFKQPDAYITKAFIQVGDGEEDWRELTDEEYEYINDHELEFVQAAAADEADDYSAGLADSRRDAQKFGESKIYNKNAKEKVLLEEAYQSVYREEKLDAAERRDLPDDDFALPGEGKGPKGKQAGSYPIPDKSHARSALSLVSQHGTPEEKKRVRAAVARKFPGIKQEDEENPDAHTYSRRGEEPGPAAELDPGIGFDEDGEIVDDISALRWSEEQDIKSGAEAPGDLEDLVRMSAEDGVTFLFDDVDLLFPSAGSEQEVMDLLSNVTRADWELKDNPYGAIVVKVGDILDDPDDDAKYETEYTDSYKQRQGGREF